MKILFTGGSSFTGKWFIQELASQGHEVVALFQKNQEGYQETRKERVADVCRHSRPIFNCSFGSDKFFDVLSQQGPWDIFCHHAADVTHYKSTDFDPIKALSNNGNNLKKALEVLQHKGCSKIILTGSVFEQGEGAGSDQLRAVSPYGLSKGLTSELFKYYCQISNMRLGKFVIPNPFGPYEEKRFTSFLVEAWYRRSVPPVDFPAYVRDNIPVSLLAKAYVDFLQQLEEGAGFQKINPSGYLESQGAFTLRFARELSSRLSLPCEVDIRQQKAFPEPKIRINTDLLDGEKLGWNEAKAWDELAAYYESIYNNQTSR